MTLLQHESLRIRVARWQLQVLMPSAFSAQPPPIGSTYVMPAIVTDPHAFWDFVCLGAQDAERRAPRGGLPKSHVRSWASFTTTIVCNTV
ncbi:hypothetical protein CI102_15311 [Trichoderma harzianum]|nr:hypothetical protein CI102_15311 [Trichoderma harzianum]